MQRLCNEQLYNKTIFDFANIIQFNSGPNSQTIFIEYNSVLLIGTIVTIHAKGLQGYWQLW